MHYTGPSKTITHEANNTDIQTVWNHERWWGMVRQLAILAGICVLSGCSSLLPRSATVSNSPWQSYKDARATFEKIVPGKTTLSDLRDLNVDPEVNPNMTILNYSDVLRRFVVSPAMDPADLDVGVRECLAAKTVCSGYEVDQRAMHRVRDGNFFADMANFSRKTSITGWRFTGLILIKDNVVVYKLTGGQPSIQEREESSNPLGPLQGKGESLLQRFF